MKKIKQDMKTIRLVYFKWNGMDLVATMKQVKSYPYSDVLVDIQAVSWGMTGIEFRGCICHEDIPSTVISHDETYKPFGGSVWEYKVSPKQTCLYFRDAIPHKYPDIWSRHKQAMRDEWAKIATDILNKIVYDNRQQHTLF